LAPSEQRFQAGFVRRVLRFALPAGAVTPVAVLASNGLARQQHTSPDLARTTAVPVTIVVSLWILVLAGGPLRAGKVGLIAGWPAPSPARFSCPGSTPFQHRALARPQRGVAGDRLRCSRLLRHFRRGRARRAVGRASAGTPRGPASARSGGVVVTYGRAVRLFRRVCRFGLLVRPPG
jgi:hypothetical protein